MTNPNKPAGVTSKYGAPRCPKTDPLPGDYYVPVFGDVEHVVAVYSDGRVGVRSPRAYSGRTYTRDDWASGPGVYGRKGEPIVGDRASGTVEAPGVPAQRTPADARLDPRPGDKYHFGSEVWTVVSTHWATIKVLDAAGVPRECPREVWSWDGARRDVRWEAAPAVGDTCATGREVPPPKRTPEDARTTLDPWDYLVTLGWDEAPRRYDRRGPGGEIVARFSVGAEGLRAFSDIRRRMAGVRP